MCLHKKANDPISAKLYKGLQNHLFGLVKSLGCAFITSLAFWLACCCSSGNAWTRVALLRGIAFLFPCCITKASQAVCNQ